MSLVKKKLKTKFLGSHLQIGKVAAGGAFLKTTDRCTAHIMKAKHFSHIRVISLLSFLVTTYSISRMRDYKKIPDTLLAERLAMFVHRFDEFPKDLIVSKEVCEEALQHPEVDGIEMEDILSISIFFWQRMSDIFYINKIESKQQKVLQMMKEHHCLDFLWNRIVKYVGGTFLHNLFIGEHEKDEIRALVQCVPEALSCYNVENKWNLGTYMLPIHSAIRRSRGVCCKLLPTVVNNLDAIYFVPILVEEGMKHDIPLIADHSDGINDEQTNWWLSCKGYQDRNARGGLLSHSAYTVVGDAPCSFNALQELANYDCNTEIRSSTYDYILRMFGSFRQMNILKKEDIVDYDLVQIAVRRKTLYLATWLIDWNPDALRRDMNRAGGYLIPLMHDCAMKAYIDENILHNGERVRHIYADHFAGMLDIAFHHFPQELGLLLLQHSHTKATTISVAYESRGKEAAWKIIEGALNKVDPTKLLTFDKETGMFPFMFAAKGNASDLNLLYYLMRKDPVVWNTNA